MEESLEPRADDVFARIEQELAASSGTPVEDLDKKPSEIESGSDFFESYRRRYEGRKERSWALLDQDYSVGVLTRIYDILS